MFSSVFIVFLSFYNISIKCINTCYVLLNTSGYIILLHINTNDYDIYEHLAS